MSDVPELNSDTATPTREKAIMIWLAIAAVVSIVLMVANVVLL